MDEELFRKSVKQAKIPVLVLDQKWHRLFALTGKPKDVQAQEKIVRDLLARQGKLNNDLISLKKIKNDLMKNIVRNMDSEDLSVEEPGNGGQMSEDSRLINEANEKISAIEDELLDLPREIDKENRELMLLTMSYCYARIRTNQTEAKEINEWISQFRVELKKNIIRKQNRVINNKEIYSYLHDIFGKDVMTLFDLRVEDFEKSEESKEKDPADGEDKDPETEKGKKKMADSSENQGEES